MPNNHSFDKNPAKFWVLFPKICIFAEFQKQKEKMRDFSHLVFNEQNAERILQFPNVVAAL